MPVNNIVFVVVVAALIVVCIVRFVAEANTNRRLSLHTIGIMPDAGLATFLQALASANNGAYRHVAD